MSMSMADEQIRVSENIKRLLDERKRPGESYNDVLNRILEDDRDLLAGWGLLSDEEADELEEHIKDSRKERMVMYEELDE